MNGVSSSRNTAGSGADLKASKGITLNYSHFEQNTNYIPNDSIGYGVYIEPGTAGTITMNTVFANGNEESNIYLDKVNSPVTLTNIEANFKRVPAMASILIIARSAAQLAPQPWLAPSP